jgi:cyclase
VSQIAREINIPFTVGGGIKTLEDARVLILAGADKISINSAAVRNPDLIDQIAGQFGNQCVVVAMDVKKTDEGWFVYLDGGRTPTTLDAFIWAQQVEKRGAGEILLTSMNHDGTKNGFALELTDRISRLVNVPVIASGGAGQKIHFRDVFLKTNTSAALAASIFHFGEIPIPELKEFLRNEKIPIR